MSTALLEQVNAALATVNDPEIKRPITELGMVDSVDVADDGSVAVHVLLTVAGCPLKDTINRDVTAAVTAVLLNLLFNVGRGESKEAAIVAESPTVGVTPEYDVPGGLQDARSTADDRDRSATPRSGATEPGRIEH